MKRTRRLRMSPHLRAMVREEHVHVDDLIYPVFVTAQAKMAEPVESMPGIFRYPLAQITEEIERVKALGIGAILLFGIPDHKDERGSGAYEENGIVPEAVRRIKSRFPDMVIIADVCLCEYTSHGHCGLVRDGIVLNDETLPLLAEAAVCYARAGADIIAPSDMMDNRVAAIREALDGAGFINVPIMSYSAKFASAYYGPFRDAAGSAPGGTGHMHDQEQQETADRLSSVSEGTSPVVIPRDRRTYQMDTANGREALREVEADIEEGADIIIAKPAIAYMDVIRNISLNYNIPIAAYNVSGEYAMVKAAAAMGWIDERRIVMENMIGMKRAGAKMIITYHAPDVARWLQEDYDD